jgi:hypothetical protein
MPQGAQDSPLALPTHLNSDAKPARPSIQNGLYPEPEPTRFLSSAGYGYSATRLGDGRSSEGAEEMLAACPGR